MKCSTAIGRLAVIAAFLWAWDRLSSNSAQAQDMPQTLPVTGEAGAGLERLDQVILETMRASKIPGVSLAVARNGSLVLAKGYGWADSKARERVAPDTFFALASVSKSLTAVTVLKLIEAGRLDLDARAFEVLREIEPLPSDNADPRIKHITIRHLLQHSGGWDRSKSGDPNSFSERVAEKMGVPLPVSPRQLTRYMLGRPLDFDPGTECRYSNFGYIVLGLIIERVTGLGYERVVRNITIRPMGLERIRLNHERGKGYLPGEAHRYGPRGNEDRQGGHLPITMASGGWLATPTEMVRFLTSLDGSRGSKFLSDPMYRAMTAAPPPPIKPRAAGGHFGLGWDQVRTTPQGLAYRKNGSLLGAHTWLEHREDGIDWALFWNGGRVEDDAGGPVPREFVRRMQEVLSETKTWPKLDLFTRRGEPHDRGHGR